MTKLPIHLMIIPLFSQQQYNFTQSNNKVKVMKKHLLKKLRVALKMLK